MHAMRAATTTRAHWRQYVSGPCVCPVCAHKVQYVSGTCGCLLCVDVSVHTIRVYLAVGMLGSYLAAIAIR